jgi:hypothetical protein
MPGPPRWRGAVAGPPLDVPGAGATVYRRLVEAAELAHLRRARDLLDREYARPLGVRDAGVRDPSGNHLRLSQPLKARG